MQTTAPKNNALLRIITGMTLGIIFFGTFFYCSSQLFSLLLGTILGIIIVAEWKNIFPVNSLYFWAILPFYPIAPFCMLIYLNESPAYNILVFYIFLLVFTFDSASYVCGKIYGKTKIIPSISPGKSWQGAIGGYCITTVVFIAISWNSNKYIDLQTACVVSAYICIIAFAGDIFESYLKRCAKIKDSSNLLPGHGGFLDRFDAIMAVSVFFFYYKVYLLALLTH